jgi:hypothetical protein
VAGLSFETTGISKLCSIAGNVQEWTAPTYCGTTSGTGPRSTNGCEPRSRECHGRHGVNRQSELFYDIYSTHADITRRACVLSADAQHARRALEVHRVGVVCVKT